MRSPAPTVDRGTYIPDGYWWTSTPGTYFWQAYGFCQGAGCTLGLGFFKSPVFRIVIQDPPPEPPPPAGGGSTPQAPNTFFTRQPRKRSHKHRVRFAFASNVTGATFECLYRAGWAGCSSPEKFRLSPGRYVFKVRARANGLTDPTPAVRAFRILRLAPKRGGRGSRTIRGCVSLCGAYFAVASCGGCRFSR